MSSRHCTINIKLLEILHDINRNSIFSRILKLQERENGPVSNRHCTINTKLLNTREGELLGATQYKLKLHFKIKHFILYSTCLWQNDNLLTFPSLVNSSQIEYNHSCPFLICLIHSVEVLRPVLRIQIQSGSFYHFDF